MPCQHNGNGNGKCNANNSQKHTHTHSYTHTHMSGSPDLSYALRVFGISAAFNDPICLTCNTCVAHLSLGCTRCMAVGCVAIISSRCSYMVLLCTHIQMYTQFGSYVSYSCTCAVFDLQLNCMQRCVCNNELN